ncbi:hypothetical protein B5M42_000775 [Paenibacillus athensensis]|nr:hypothetical protein [Paenibacillus athensensis]MCD1257368.1 hypothetical protein [Paenibacillus athensensis]
MKEAIARGEAYKQVLEGDLLYVVNEQTNERSDSRKLYGQPHPAMERPAAKAAAAFGYLPNSGLIDPTSLGDTGIQPSIPYSYEATPGQSAMYIATLEADGWRIIGSYRTQSYLDYYLQKQDVVARVIVLQDSMKVFDNVKPELPNPKTFAAQEAP